MRKQRNIARLFITTLALASLMSGVALIPTRPARAQTIGGTWTVTGSLNTRRTHHTATLLPNGKVLAVGGVNNNLGSGPILYTTMKSAELYDPVTGGWNYTGSLNTARYFHTATLLRNGQVLVAGGADYETFSPVAFHNSAELYDPATGQWHPTGSLNTISGHPYAALLADGKVLAVGTASPGAPNPIYSAELYDPATGTWTSTTAPLNFLGHPFFGSLTPLANGKVLGLGVTSAELYDPATGTWSSAGSLDVIREFRTASLLHNGNVLVTGWTTGSSLSAELYDPNTGSWSITSSPPNGVVSTATLLSDGRVLFTGNYDAYQSPPRGRGEEVYDPATGTWSQTSLLDQPRSLYTATLLSDGRVLAAGGSDGGYDYGEIIFNNAEVYTPDARPAFNQIDDAQFFVRQHYRDFLNRDPDAGGLAYWTDRITSCGSDARCIHERRIGVSAAFFIEQEFQDSGYYVYRFHKASFGRQPNFTEFTSDRGTVIGGPDLEASKQAFADEWVQRPAFVAAYPFTLSNAEVVNKLFDSAGLTGSIYDAQRQQEISAMNAGRSRALVLRDVIEIADFKNVPNPNDPRYSEIKQTSQYNPAFVLMQYFGYLRRDLDQGGYDFWLDIVNNREPNNFRGMVCAFVTSTEYQLRFGSVVTRSNADCSQ